MMRIKREIAACICFWICIAVGYCEEPTVARTYYPTGELLSEISYNEDGEKDGLEVVYYEDGQIAHKIPYQDGKRQGMATFYYRDGRFKFQIPYEDDQIHGIKRRYSFMGNLTWEIPYIHGKRHGIARRYYKGELKSEIEFINDKRKTYH